MPAALREIGACSREEPQPKLAPATMIWPGTMLRENPGRTSSMQCAARTAGSELFRYRAAMMSSVFTFSPKSRTVPLNTIYATSEGVVIRPVTALAAAVAGEAR